MAGEKFFEKVGLAAVAVVMVALLAILLAYPTMWAVNYLVAPGIVTFLFGSFGFWKAFAFNYLLAQLRSK
jgi:hypothetical protein